MNIGSDDKIEIADLVTRYNNAFDHDDVEAFVDTFTADGAFVSQSGERTAGRAALTEWFAARDHTTIHVTANALVEEREGEIHHRCTVLVYKRRAGEVELRSVGWYADVLARTAEGWRFKERAPTTIPVRR